MKPAEDTQLQQYGAISPLAILALLLGIASVAALIGLGWLVVPLVAVIVAALALAKIAASEGALVGRAAAAVGLMLALLFASIAVTRTVARQSILTGHARQFADDWLEQVRSGQLESAHQLHLPPAERQAPGTALRDYYQRSTTARNEMDTFFSQPLLRTVIQAPPAANIKFNRVAAHFPGEDFDRVDLLYELKLPDGKTTPLVVIAERFKGDEGGRWRIGAVSPPQPGDATG